VGLAAQDQARVLDLTRPPEPAKPPVKPYNMQSCRLGGRGAGRSFGVPPFALAVEGFDTPEYSMGGPIVVDLKLTNTSPAPLSIPTVLADQFHDPFEGDEAVQFAFMIAMSGANGEQHELTGTMLRGSTRFPDTTELLAPGESVTIHFPGYIPITDGSNPPTTREGQLYAALLVSDGECRMWDPVRSKAVGRVRFTGR
jgi:hypothetical protein